jgi:hypothetical protein
MRCTLAAPLKATSRRAQAFAPRLALRRSPGPGCLAPRAALAFAKANAMGPLGQEIDANKIKSQNIEQSRNNIGETLARPTVAGLSAA